MRVVCEKHEDVIRYVMVTKNWRKRAQAKCIKSMYGIPWLDIKNWFFCEFTLQQCVGAPFLNLRPAFLLIWPTHFLFLFVVSFQKKRLIPRISLYCSNTKEVNCNTRNARFRIDGNGLRFSGSRASAILSSRQSYRTKQLSFGSFTTYSRAFKVPNESKSIVS